ncbi:sugar phosphate isomerase [Saccharothrix sp. NRRL B-16348]|uniref:EboA domain-containing protein n=1 Tax=Saccharothrix sp. NRRL B-16348 TaxID=1415542 RepID=UPI0006AFEC58|nr:EboA domain-containing protein [Saccharothrix sp. NRRL B-16348]KOX23971.1 sugar phosphate isomerase [Saccharothrix sp. NRRL B-16348]
MTFRLGYGTNGFANHRLDDALAVIAGLGYTGVALTLDHHHLDPFAPDLPRQVEKVAARLDRLGLGVVVETGARFLLDPRRKHHPTLVSDAQEVRVDFLLRAVGIAADLGADCVSFWSGIVPAGVDDDEAWRRMRSGVTEVLDGAARRGVPIALEPEPGMLVERLDQALRLRAELGSPALLGITLDVGHCVAVEPEDAAACVRRAGDLLLNVQLDDMLPGVHEHLEFGEGELDLAATLAALDEIGYTGLAGVELPRHSHAAPDVASRAMSALREASPKGALHVASHLPVGVLREDSPNGTSPLHGASHLPVSALREASGPEAEHPWLAEAERAVRADPQTIRTFFPAVGRVVGRQAVRGESDPLGVVHGTVDDVGRTRLLAALAAATGPEELAAELTSLYRFGDDAERRGVLRALASVGHQAVTAGVELVKDALRTNDTRLVAAALGPFAADHLDAHTWRHGVLKCLFLEIPLAAVAGLDRRADEELRRMVGAFAAERRAAGRAVPDDALELLRSET